MPTVTGNGNAFVTLLPTRDPKDIVADLPLGLLADPQAVPRCPLAQVTLNSARERSVPVIDAGRCARLTSV